jgi:proline iminopeptidase
LLAKGYYPKIEPYWTGYLPVSDGHILYWEQSGNPRGTPVVFLHGGPGAGIDADQRRFFDPQFYRIILFDQRGSGKSTPQGCLDSNSTWDLVDDLELLRETLRIDNWIVFGGSWGTTLGLTYAIKHPDRVNGLILRGIFLGRQKELDWFYKQGANLIHPDFWNKFLEPIPHNEQGDLIKAYYQRLTSNDSSIKRNAACNWTLWELANLKYKNDLGLSILLNLDLAQNLFKTFYGSYIEPMACIECHYFYNHCFFDTDNWILDNAAIISHIPTVIIHGAHDTICPLESAIDLHQALPQSKLIIVPDSGHSATEPGNLHHLIEATDSFIDLFQ